MSKATTPDEGAIKTRVRIAVQAELGDDFDEAEFNDAFNEAIQQADTYQQAYDKTVELLQQAEDTEDASGDASEDETATAEQALRKLADSARSRKKG